MIHSHFLDITIRIPKIRMIMAVKRTLIFATLVVAYRIEIKSGTLIPMNPTPIGR